MSDSSAHPRHSPASNLIGHPSSVTVSADEFKAAFRNHPAGVALITADAGDGPVALTATSVFSVSAEPPILVFSLSELSSSTPTIRRAQTVVVHLLGASQIHLAQLGAAKGVDRFADTALWTRLATGEPYFPSAHAWIRGQVINTIDAGGSVVVVVQALQTHAPAAGDAAAEAKEAEPLVYHNRAWHRLSESSEIRLP